MHRMFTFAIEQSEFLQLCVCVCVCVVCVCVYVMCVLCVCVRDVCVCCVCVCMCVVCVCMVCVCVCVCHHFVCLAEVPRLLCSCTVTWSHASHILEMAVVCVHACMRFSFCLCGQSTQLQQCIYTHPHSLSSSPPHTS